MTRVSGSILTYLGDVLLHPNSITLRRSSGAMGDNLLLSCLVREIKRVRPRKHVILETAWPDLFRYNPYVHSLYTGNVSPRYHRIKYRIDPGTTEHIIDQLVRQLPFPVSSWERRVELFLPEKELTPKFTKLPSQYIAVNPTGKQGHTANRKEWGFEKFAALRERMREIPFVQIGDADTPLLPGAEDYRGRPILESAWIVRQALTGVFLEGGLMHLAAAVERPSVIVYGGVVSPRVSGYDMHENISHIPECGPCFTSHSPMTVCDTMICMAAIGVDRVEEAARRLAARAAS